MSTLKKIIEPIIWATTIVIGMAVVLDKITIYETWFSIRTLQISLGSGLSVLLFLYVQSDRKNLSPNTLKVLLFKSKLAVISLFSIFLWIILSKPVAPVSVSFEGVAKTTDVVATKRNIQKTNENITQVGAILSSFKEKQEKTNKEFSEQLSSFKSKLIELDKDEQIRQQATSDQVTDLTNDLKELSVGVDDIKKIDRQTYSIDVSTTGTSSSDSARVQIIVSILILAIISFLLSFFFKTYTRVSIKTRRYIIPICLILLSILVYFYPLVVSSFSSLSGKKNVTQDTFKFKTKTPIVIDTNKAKRKFETQIQPTTLSDSSNEQETKEKVKKIIPKYTPPIEYIRVSEKIKRKRNC